MKYKFNKLVVVFFLLSFSTTLLADSAIVDGLWLIKNTNKPNLVVVDIQSKDFYRQFHVPGAVNLTYSMWRTDNKSKQPGNILPLKKLTTLLGQNGISEKNNIIIVATGTGAGDMAAAARVFWTLKVLGHKHVSILDGGLASYANVHKGALSNQPVTRAATTYKATPNYDIVADIDTTLKAVKSKSMLLDARSRGEFVGVVQGGKDERPGTIPGAKNLPFDWITINQSGTLRDKKQIKLLFESIYAETSNNTIHFCHSGNRAALTWFVDYAVLGHKKAKLYDASMMEWAIDKSKSIDLIFPLNK